MLRKVRDVEQLTQSLKAAAGKLKRLISLRKLSGLQEASQDENTVLSAEQGTVSLNVPGKIPLYLQM